MIGADPPPPRAPVLVLRAEPGASGDVEALAALGVSAIACPLMREAAVHIDCAVMAAALSAARRDGVPILLTSRRAVAAIGRAGLSLAGLSGWCVGPATAKAARAAGVRIDRVGGDGLCALLDGADPRPILWLAGDPRRAVPPAWADRVAVHPVYRMEPVAGRSAGELAAASVLVVHSAAVARRAATLLDDPAARATVRVAALSPAVAAAMGAGWRDVAVGPSVDGAALLALAARLWQGAANHPRFQAPVPPLSDPAQDRS